MGFITKVDLSENRQAKERQRTNTILSGATQLGVPFSAMTSGPDYSTEVVWASATTLTSTFTGTSASTVYSWANPNMAMGEGVLNVLTSLNSGTTQNTDSVYTAWTTTVIDGNTVTLTYSGVSFDVTVNEMTETAPNVYSGNVNTAVLKFLSAGTLDFTGRTIWSDVKGIHRTEKLVVTNPIVPPTSGTTGDSGTIAWDTNYLYVCVAPNTWKRASLSTW